jgi:photosystem II stability/assembly factor-like uncharacterized protein
MNMKKRFILLTAALLSFSAIAQESKVESEDNSQTFSSIFDLMKRRDLDLKTIEKLADDYFKIHGTARGSGYKQYQRWLFESKFHVDANGNFISPQSEAAEYTKFGQNSTSANNKGMVAPVGSWTDLGPFQSTVTKNGTPGKGRLTCMAIHPSSPNTIYVGSPGGGIWKTTNAGSTWQPLTDNNALRMQIYSIAIDPNNQSVVYAGTGENANVVIKSTDSGQTWFNLGSGPTGFIRKILIHPTNSSIVFAAADNGLYRSTNGGTSWTQVSTIPREDVEFKPGDPNIMYTCGKTRVSISTNGGVNWATLGATQGITNNDRSLIAVTPNNPNYVYVLQANGNRFGRLYLSTNSGGSFTTRVIGDTTGRNYFSYETNGTTSGGLAGDFMAICASPSNANEVHIGCINIWKSTDAGLNFTAKTNWFIPNPLGYVHTDILGLEFAASKLYILSDGGINLSNDNAENFSSISAGLGIKQVNNIASSNTDFNVFVSGSQDNGTFSRNAAGNYVEWIGGDGQECIVSPTNPLNIWGTVPGGEVWRSTDGGQTNTFLSKFGGNFYTSIAGHPTNENIIFGAGEGVFKSTDGGSSFTKISGTTIPVELQKIAVAPSNPNYIYASFNRTLYVTKNGGTTWQGLPQPDLGMITDIAISPSDPTKLWYTTNTGKVFRITNAGSNITDLTGSLPSIAARSIVVDFSTNENLYVGMNVGVFTRSNNDPTWTEITANMPKTAIFDLDIQKSSGRLRAGTYGRGIWEYTPPNALCLTAYEPNDANPTAKFIFKNTNIYAAISSSTDEDWYTFNLKSVDNVSVFLGDLPFDYDVEVFNSAGVKIGSGTNSGTTTEFFNLSNLAAGNYKVRIFSFNKANFSPSCYFFSVTSNLASKGSNTNSIEAESGDNKTSGASVILFPNPTSNQLNVDLSSFQDVSTVLIMNKEGVVLARHDNVGNNKSLKFDVSLFQPGIYFMQILSVQKELKTLKFIKE